MKQQQVDYFKKWFDDYVAGFYCDDEVINANIKLKDDHSRRVCDEMAYLTGHLALEEDKKRLAYVVALLHDIGRFEQFVRYRTYNDPRSINHCQLGLEVLRETNVLKDIEQTERILIEKTVQYHGVKELPSDMAGDELLFCKLIRDADKLDIFYVVMEYYKQYREDPDNFKIELEFADTLDYSQELVDDIMSQRKTDYHKLKSFNDMKLLQLGWVYDVNYSATLKRIKEKGYLEQILGFLPNDETIKKVREKVFQYVDMRIKGDIQL